MDLADCRSLLGHAEWADALVWASVADGGLEDDELRARLHHLHVAQWAYLHAWRAEPVKPRELGTFPTMVAVRAWAREYYRELPVYLASASGQDVEREVRFPWAERLVQRFGHVPPASWAESVLQVALHSSHHRGPGDPAAARARGGGPAHRLHRLDLDGPARGGLGQRRGRLTGVAAGALATGVPGRRGRGQRRPWPRRGSPTPLPPARAGVGSPAAGRAAAPRGA